MLTLRNELARTFALAIGQAETDRVATETLRTVFRLTNRLLVLADAGPESVPVTMAPPGGDPSGAGIERHAQPLARLARRNLEAVPAAPGPERIEALGVAAEAMHELATWCRYAGYYEFFAACVDAVLAAWPAGVRPERRIQVAFVRSLREVWGAAGDRPAPPASAVADALEAQIREARLPGLLPLADHLRGVHELNCGRFGDAERIARSIIRRARRHGITWVEGFGLELATVASGRQGRFFEAIEFSLRAVKLEGAPSAMRVMALSNVGVSLQMAGLYDAALEAHEAALAWERRLDTRPEGLLQTKVLRQILELHGLRGLRDQFLTLYHRLAAAPMVPIDRVFFHRDAASGLMRFGDVAAALEELAKAQALAERHGFHYDWFAIEKEIQEMRNVRSRGRDVAHLERPHAKLVEDARAAWQTVESDPWIPTGV